MKIITFTLVADGTSDESLLPLIYMMFNERYPDLPVSGEFAVNLPPARDGLQARLSAALKQFPCDLLFVHRDSENQSHVHRENEIAAAIQDQERRAVPVVPVRMLEAWLLHNEQLVRRAAGNPNGTAALNLPVLARLETVPDPKLVLLAALRAASELTGRRLRTFNERACLRRIAELVESLQPLRTLPSFQRFEAAFVHAVTRPPSLHVVG